MRQLLGFGLLCLLMLSLNACEQSVPEFSTTVTFVNNSLEDQQNAVIELEDVFAAKASRDSEKVTSQSKQDHKPSIASRVSMTSNKPQSNSKKPRIRIEKDIYDFGFVDEGELVSHSFRLFNDGPGTWLIEEILPSCGCTDVKATAMKIVSGAYVDISFNLETAGRPGAQQKLIEVFSNAGYHRLLIKGVVYPPKFSEEKPQTKTSKDSL